MEQERELKVGTNEGPSLPLGMGMEDYPADVDSEDELLAQHSLRRGLMEQRSVAKTMFLEQPKLFGYHRVRDRLMMPTDLDKWSRDQMKHEHTMKALYEHDGERLAELHQFVVAGGAAEQRARFEEVVGWTQDQAIPGREDSLELLMQLQKPMVEVSLLNSAFAALEQHVTESNEILDATMHDTKHDLEKQVNQRWLPEVLSTIPTIEEFQTVFTDSERLQLNLSHEQTWDDVSGFRINGSNGSQILPTPNTDSSSKTIAIVTQINTTTKPSTSDTDFEPLLSIHQGLPASSANQTQNDQDYWSAEDLADL